MELIKANLSKLFIISPSTIKALALRSMFENSKKLIALYLKLLYLHCYMIFLKVKPIKPF